jgi:hypothetical protein
MDEKGFIFTTDSILALAVVIVFTASVMTYFYAPIYMGSDHQHLEALADSALNVMEQDGTITNAAAESYKGNYSGAEYILNSRLRMLIPSDIAYNMTLTSTDTISVENDRGMLYSRDTATKVRVLSLPREGWMGRAWYKIEKFEFEDNEQNVTTTLWNFHNWLTNFSPWNNGLGTVGYWGASSSAPYRPVNISFSFPSGSTILGAKYLSGSGYAGDPPQYNPGNAFSTNLTLNGVNVYTANQSQYIFLNTRPGSSRQRMYNYQGIFNVSQLNTGVNNFYLRFFNTTTNVNMPWFGIIGNYTTSFPVPKGIVSQTFRFNDAAGMAVPTAQNLGGGGNEYGRIYDLYTGGVTSFTTRRSIPWSSFRLQDASNYGGVNYQNGEPFVMTGVSGEGIPSAVTSTKCAVSVTQDVYVPAGNVIFDAFTVINPYGGVDGAMVEVYNGTHWRTVFRSFNSNEGTFSDRTDGYGNIPGIVSIPTTYLSTGRNNKIRVTIWDDVPSSDYDLVGLVDCYTTVTYSALNIGWVNSYYDNKQVNSNIQTQTKSFDIDVDASNVFLFVGTGLDSKHLKVAYPPAMGGHVLYDSDTIPYYLDIAALDAAGPDLVGNDGPHRITTPNSTASKYWLKQGRQYNLTVTVTAPSNAWESGDGATSPPRYANAEIFTGTRISVLYPEVLRNVWTLAYNDTATSAMNKAKEDLIRNLNTSDPHIINNIKTEALFTGDFPNQIPVRLSLWRQ